MTKIGLYENFEKALTKLQEFTSLPVSTERDAAGVVQAFEFTFEQCWKGLQRVLELEGVQAASPKQAFREGMNIGLLDQKDEEQWIAMIKDRNVSSHVYDQAAVKEILDRILAQYCSLFADTLKAIKSRLE